MDQLFAKSLPPRRHPPLDPIDPSVAVEDWSTILLRITPHPAQATAAATAAEFVRTLLSETTLRPLLETPVTVGSYARRTATRWTSDVDVLVPLLIPVGWRQRGRAALSLFVEPDAAGTDLPSADFVMETINREVFRFLENRRGSLLERVHGLRVQSKSIRLECDQLHIDMIPAVRTHQGHVLVADWGRKRWRLTRLDEQQSQLDSLDLRWSGRLRELIHILKAWNASTLETSRVASIVVEGLAFAYASQRRTEAPTLDAAVTGFVAWTTTLYRARVAFPAGQDVASDLPRARWDGFMRELHALGRTLDSTPTMRERVNVFARTIGLSPPTNVRKLDSKSEQAVLSFLMQTEERLQRGFDLDHDLYPQANCLRLLVPISAAVWVWSALALFMEVNKVLALIASVPALVFAAIWFSGFLERYFADDAEARLRWESSLPGKIKELLDANPNVNGAEVLEIARRFMWPKALIHEELVLGRRLERLISGQEPLADGKQSAAAPTSQENANSSRRVEPTAERPRGLE